MSNQADLPKQIYITKDVLRQIEHEISDRPPEQGGALLGPPGVPAITRFIYDSWAHTTGASYVPSDELIDQVPRIERHEDLEFKGIIHSHPAGIGHPSGQDIHGPFTRALNENPHLSFFLGPILTHGNTFFDRESHHVIKCGRGSIAFYIAYREGSRTEVKPIQCQAVTDKELAWHMAQRKLESTVQKFPPAVQQIRQDLGQIAKFFDIKSELAIVPMEIDERSVYGVQIPLSPRLELTLIISESYPFTPPIAIVSDVAWGKRRQLEQLHLTWDLGLSPQKRLITALSEHFLDKTPGKKTYGTANAQFLTEDPAVAELAGWDPFWGNGKLASDELYAELLKRSKEILSQAMSSRHVLVVGLGSVGSYLSELLVRSGVGKLTLVDPESVEAVNLSRTVYEVGDIGKPKVNALARRLLNISPMVRLNRYAVDLTNLSLEEVDCLVTEADLVIAATDDPEAQRALNRFAYARGKPAVFVGIYAKADGGEVIYVLPEITSCYLCATRHRLALGKTAPGIDYLTGRLVGEVALAADIQHISSAAAKVALSLLLLKEPVNFRYFIRVPASRSKNFIAFANVPNFWVFPYLMSDVLGQYAYQSLWVTVGKQPECEVCGDNRRDPMTVPMRSASVSRLHEIHAKHKGHSGDTQSLKTET
jgi:proteasome lid subunit RPN8/RPN11